MNEYKVWLAKLVTIGFFLLVLLPLLAGAFVAVEKADTAAVAVVKVQGVIEDSTDALTALYKQAADKDVPAIVLRVDSPGGAVGPSEELFHAVRRLKDKKPIVVSMGSVAASGGLYAALGASKILCQPGTQTGSIGVVMQVPNFTSIAGKVGFDMITVKSGAMKDVGNPFRPMSDADRAFLEGTAAKVHDTFIRAVVEGRGLPEEKVRQFADGRVIIGTEAKDLGLVDDFGDIYDAARLALSLAGVEVPADELPTLKYANKEKNRLAQLLESVSSVPDMISQTTQVPVLKYLAAGY
jgi:protease-4